MALAIALIAGVTAPVALAGTSGPAAAAPATALDHFECYAAATAHTKVLPASFKVKPRAVRLRNHFASAGFVAGLGKVHMQCSPAQQTDISNGHLVTSSITKANTRLVCWALSPKALRLPPSVRLKNQFGTAVLKPTAARSLCLPSWKNKAKPLKFPSSSAPASLDSYACYSAVHPAGTPSFAPPRSVALKDQFGAATTRVGAPNMVCLPTARRVNSHRWTKLVNSTDYAVCFALPARASAARTAYNKNQFGTGAVKASHDTELCLPSVVAAATPTTTVPVPVTTMPPTTAPATTVPVTTTTTAPSPPHWMPTAQAPISWYWQLQGAVNLAVPAQVYEIDGFDNTASTVAALHAQGKTAICYIDFGTAESNRSDFSSFPASVLGLTNGFPGETWLDIRQLAVLEPIMTARMQMCVQKGFDALEADNVDGFNNATGFPLTAQDQLTYNTWIATTAHRLGLSVGLKNDNTQTAQLQPYFDWALDEQCNEFSQCGTEQVFTNANKAVFNAEYSGGTAFCPSDAAAHINGALFDVNLAGATYQPCVGTW